MDVNGKAAIVTGGASGMGAATARALGAAGARIAIFDINEPVMQETAAAIGGLALVCDVSDGAATEAAFAQARDQHGAAQILVNCAGVGVLGPTRMRYDWVISIVEQVAREVSSAVTGGFTASP